MIELDFWSGDTSTITTAELVPAKLELMPPRVERVERFRALHDELYDTTRRSRWGGELRVATAPALAARLLRLVRMGRSVRNRERKC